jgi:DNA-binding transcriptional MerR regulator
MNAYAEIQAYSLQPFRPDPDAVYTIDTIAHLADVPRHLVLLACRHGLIVPLIEPEYGGYRFDVRAIQVLRRIHYLHQDCDINFAGIRIIMGLMEEVERLRASQRDW